MASRSFVNEHDDDRRRELHSDTVLRSSPSARVDKSTATSSPSVTQVELPERATSTFRATHPSTWFKALEAARKDQKVVLQVGIVFVVMIVLLFILAAIATESGQNAPGRFPRLLFFTIDGVSVEEFKRAASLRRVPSMDFFASQSANCRPLAQDEYFRPLPQGETWFSSRFSECVMQDDATRVGTMYSLLTGNAFSSQTAGGNEVTLERLLRGDNNFTTFLSAAQKQGLTSAILGSAPLLSTTKPAADNDNDNRNDVQCGILDAECVVHAAAGDRVPKCTVPAGREMSPAAMITASSSCNSAFQGSIAPTDTPADIWRRLRYVIYEEADVVFVQIPQATVRYWMSQRAAGSGSTAAAHDEDSSFSALDAVLYEIDGIFSKLIRSIALQSVEQGEQWLTLLSVSSPKEREILLASNVIASGMRQDAGNVYEVSSLTPERLHHIVADWLKKKPNNN